jgi:hypothetical protein
MKFERTAERRQTHEGASQNSFSLRVSQLIESGRVFGGAEMNSYGEATFARKIWDF